MKQIKRLKRGKISLFLAAAVLSLGILSGCGAESKEAKEARMTGIEQLNAGNYQDAIDSFGKALDESDGIVNSFELDVLKYRGEAEYKLADYKAAAQTYGILAEVDGGKAEYLYYKAASEAAAGQADDAEIFKGTAARNYMRLIALRQLHRHAKRNQGKITLFQHHLTRRTQVDPVRFAVNVGESVNGVCEIFDLYVHAVHICMKSFLMSHFIW